MRRVGKGDNEIECGKSVKPLAHRIRPKVLAMQFGVDNKSLELTRVGTSGIFALDLIISDLDD